MAKIASIDVAGAAPDSCPGEPERRSETPPIQQNDVGFASLAGSLLSSGITENPFEASHSEDAVNPPPALLPVIDVDDLDWAALRQMIKAGEMKPVIDSVVPLEGAAEALRLIQDRKVIGKVIVTP